MIKSKKIPFTEQENLIIQNSVKLLGEDWHEISKKLHGRTPKQIHDRYINYLREGLKNGPCTNQEDEILIKMYRIIGPKWTKMMSNLPGRSGNDIKNRWHKHLIKRPYLQSEINYEQNINYCNNINDSMINNLPPQNIIHIQPKAIILNEPIIIDSRKTNTNEIIPQFYGLVEIMPNYNSVIPKQTIEIKEFLDDLNSHNLAYPIL